MIEAGRKATGRRDIRCTVSIGGFVPKPHTPFQWAAQCRHETVDARLRALGAALRADRNYGQGDRLPLPRRQAVDHRGVAVPRRPAGGEGDPGRVAGRRPVRRLERDILVTSAGTGARRLRWPPNGVDLAWYTTRERGYDEICRGTTWTPGWTGTGCGRTGWPRSTRRARPRWRTAGGRRASSAASARRWAPRSRSGRPGRLLPAQRVTGPRSAGSATGRRRGRLAAVAPGDGSLAAP